MDAPICRLCDTKHWSREPCPARPTGKRHRPLKPAPVLSMSVAASRADLEVDKKQRWDREAYNKYQRAYMKKLRARAKLRMRKRRAQ